MIGKPFHNSIGWGMRTIPAIALLLLAACDSPSPWYDRAAGVAVDAGKHRFRVYSNGQRAQAIRIDRTRRPHVAQVVPLAMIAIGKATGCSIVDGRAKGDTNVVDAQIDCD